jgi:hypothetical protein
MRRLAVPLALLLGAGVARAQERVPQTEACALAKIITLAAAKLKPPIAIAADTDKPYAKKKDEYGAMFLPDKRLSAERLARAGKDIVPVAVLWTHQLAPVAGGKVVPGEKLQGLSVTLKEEKVTLTVCYIGVRQGPRGGLEMVVLSKDTKPLVTLLLEKAEGKQELPIEFLATIEGNDRAILTLGLLGKYKTKLTLGVPTD